MGEERAKKNGHRTATGEGQVATGGDGEKGSGATGGTRLQAAWLCPWWFFCRLLCLAGAPTSGWSSWLSSLLSLPTWPPINHLEAFSSAVREEGYGSHPHEMSRPAVSRAFVGLWLEEWIEIRISCSS